MRLFTAFSMLCLAVILASCSQQQNDVRQLPSSAQLPSNAQRSPHTRFTQLYEFDGTIGAGPLANLVEFRGLLYGTTYTGAGCCGGVFSIHPSDDVTKVVYGFTHVPDGAYPSAGLTVLNDRLYGTTTAGGAHSHHGTVFSVDPATGAEHVLHSFSGADGSRPESELIAENGLLYGTTLAGGAHNLGTVFDVDPATGAEHVLHSFSGAADGMYPKAGLVFAKGLLYGTTHEGGDCCGTIFELNPSTKVERVVFKFDGSVNGGYPRAAMIAINGRLYGTTERGGGAAGSPLGNVFEFDPSTGAERTIFNFDHATGTNPYAGLTFMGGKLFGTTYRGGDLSACGQQGCGTVFELSLDGAARVLVRFSGANGQHPESGLVALNGRLYGTTVNGGTGAGTVFEVLP